MIKKTNNLEIRKMTEHDIEDVLKIENISFSVPWSKKAFINEIRDNRLSEYIVALKEGIIVGYGGMWVIIDEGHITNIAVHPEYRNQSVGSAIVEGLINLCKKNNILRMTLEVRFFNKKAQSLYKKYGFEECGIRPGYYSDTKEDAIIMWKEIF